MSYNSPKITVLGSVAEMTMYKNKVGPTPDVTTSTSPIGVVGSIVEVGNKR